MYSLNVNHWTQSVDEIRAMQELGLPSSRKRSLQLEGDCECYEYWKR